MENHRREIADPTTTETRLRALAPDYALADLRDLHWCLNEMARLGFAACLTTMTRAHVANILKLDPRLIRDDPSLPVPFACTVWSPLTRTITPDTALHPTALAAAQAALAALWPLGFAAKADAPDYQHTRHGQTRGMRRRIEDYWRSLAGEITGFGVDCTMSQARSIPWLARTLETLGYSISVSVETRERFAANGWVAEGATEEHWASPPMTYRLWGPLYAERGAHTSPFSANVECAMAVALLNLARLAKGKPRASGSFATLH